jgi:Na+-driven multidrug efflux pump
MSKQKPPLQPTVHLAPPAKLNAYVLYEHELDALSQGAPSSLMLNFSLFFLGVAATSFGTLFSIPGESDRAYYTFLILFLVTTIAGVVLLGLWWFMRTPVRRLIAEIKSQMPPNPETRNEPDSGSSPAAS